MHSEKAYLKLAGMYGTTYMAIGAMVPLLSSYLKDIGLNGIQIGTVSSIGSFMGIVAPPFFGHLSDRTHKHKAIMLITIGLTALLALLLPIFHSYAALLLIFGAFYFFQSSIAALVDGISLHVPIPFGKLRQWGSYGFALSVFIMGYVAEHIGKSLIFYAFSLITFCGFLILTTLKVQFHHEKSTDSSGLKSLLMRKDFLLFVLICFFISGTLASNNVYFGLHYQALGGNLAGVGLAFLLFAASEAPFMQLAASWIRRFGIENVLIASVLIGIFRWAFYALSPSPTVLVVTFFLQGLFYGPYLVATAEWVRAYVPSNVRSTAMTLYSGFGFGLGSIFCNFIGGFLLDRFGTYAVFIYFTVVCFLGLLLLFPLRRLATRVND